jgi:RHS repeat-associated protein
MIATADSYSHDAFGQISSDTATGIEILFLYTARPFDTDSNLQNNLNRWYDLSNGRWISVDPIGFLAGNANLHAYANADPASYSDPFGLYHVDAQGRIVLDPGDPAIQYFISEDSTREIAVDSRSTRSCAAIPYATETYPYPGVKLGVEADKCIHPIITWGYFNCTRQSWTKIATHQVLEVYMPEGLLELGATIVGYSLTATGIALSLTVTGVGPGIAVAVVGLTVAAAVDIQGLVPDEYLTGRELFTEWRRVGEPRSYVERWAHRIDFADPYCCDDPLDPVAYSEAFGDILARGTLP